MQQQEVTGGSASSMGHPEAYNSSLTNIRQPDDAGSAAKPPPPPPRRFKIAAKSPYGDDTSYSSYYNNSNKAEAKGVEEVSVPFVHGTIAFYLGRKATESQSHKWTVYVRGAANEDLGVVISRVVFQLHPSFNNPTRVVTSPPFHLSESGWGEFEIGISIFFHSDVSDKQLDLVHQLRLYPEDETGPQSTKKPVVREYYNEIVFTDPSDNFLARVLNHPAVNVPRLPSRFNFPAPVKIENMTGSERGDTKDHPLYHWFNSFSEADELLKLTAARQQVQAHLVKLRRQLNVIDGLAQPRRLETGFQ